MPKRLLKGKYRMSMCRFCYKTLSKEEIDLHAFTCNVINQAVCDGAKLRPSLKGSSLDYGNKNNGKQD